MKINRSIDLHVVGSVVFSVVAVVETFVCGPVVEETVVVRILDAAGDTALIFL